MSPLGGYSCLSVLLTHSLVRLYNNHIVLNRLLQQREPGTFACDGRQAERQADVFSLPEMNTWGLTS